jgi:small subunit ribosomal protein S8
MVNDIIADSITRIRNAYTRRKKDTVLLYSKIIEKSLGILKEKKYIENFKIITIKDKKFLKVVLTYENEVSPINEITRVSKPGRRVYKQYTDLKSFKSGYGTMVVSTNIGVITNKQAFDKKVGGEVLFSVW